MRVVRRFLVRRNVHVAKEILPTPYLRFPTSPLHVANDPEGTRSAHTIPEHHTSLHSLPPLPLLVMPTVCIVSTSAATFGPENSIPTGVWLEELATPYYLFKAKGYDVVSVNMTVSS
jgi:hypothetical protein